MSRDASVALVTAFLTGGPVGAIVLWRRFRLDETRAPADQASIVAAGAEAAVTSLTAALARADRRIEELEARDRAKQLEILELRDERRRAEEHLSERDRRIDNLEARVLDLLDEVNALRPDRAHNARVDDTDEGIGT